MELTSDLKAKVQEHASNIIKLSELVCSDHGGIVDDELAFRIQQLCADVQQTMCERWNTPEGIAAFQGDIRTLSEFLVKFGGPFPVEVDREVCEFFWLS